MLSRVLFFTNPTANLLISLLFDNHSASHPARILQKRLEEAAYIRTEAV
jgi:hypothetical protein